MEKGPAEPIQTCADGILAKKMLDIDVRCIFAGLFFALNEARRAQDAWNKELSLNDKKPLPQINLKACPTYAQALQLLDWNGGAEYSLRKSDSRGIRELDTIIGEFNAALANINETGNLKLAQDFADRILEQILKQRQERDD